MREFENRIMVEIEMFHDVLYQLRKTFFSLRGALFGRVNETSKRPKTYPRLAFMPLKRAFRMSLAL